MSRLCIVAWLVAASALSGCSGAADPNKEPAYGASGLPSNCRAYVEFAVYAYRKGAYSADETMTGLQRNCGANGQLWSSK